MSGKTPLLLLPGMLCDAELWSHQVDTLGDVADITVADLSRDDSMEGMAERVLASAPKRFALAGLSMGGYVAQEIMRQAPERVLRLALLDTSSNVDTPGQTERRKGFMEQVRHGEFKGVTARLIERPDFVLLCAAAAFAANLALQAAGALVFRTAGMARALTLGLASGNRNMGLVLAVLADKADFDVVVFFAVGQLPMYILPALLKPLYRRLIGT